MSAELTMSLDVLEEVGGLDAVLLNAGEMALLAEVKDAAAALQMSPGVFTLLAVRRFIERADHEDWASLISRANAKEDAMAAAVTLILRRAVGDVREAVP